MRDTRARIGLHRMADTLTPLILDMLEWLAVEPRAYAEVMQVWRTSCPRLTVWEDAIDRGLVERRFAAQRGLLVELTPLGRSFLASSRNRNHSRDGDGSRLQDPSNGEQA
jgi:hypothetical protein